MVLEEMLNTDGERRTVEYGLTYGCVEVQGKATIDKYDLEEGGLAALANAQLHCCFYGI